MALRLLVCAPGTGRAPHFRACCSLGTPQFRLAPEVAGLQVGPGTKTLHQFKPGCGSVPPFSTLKLAGEGWSPRHVLGAGSRHAAPQPVLLVLLKTGFGALLKPLKSSCCLPMLLQRMCLKYRKSFCRNTREFGNQGLSYTILAEGWPAFSLALSWDPPLP